MKQNRVFAVTRLRLSGLYVGTMGLILSICGLGFYTSMEYSHWESLNRKLGTIAGTLHDGIEPTLQMPGQIEPTIHNFLPGVVCASDIPCPTQTPIGDRHVAGVVRQNDYYIRFINLSGKQLANVGRSPQTIPSNFERNPWQTFREDNGIAYRQVSIFLKTNNQNPWGYIQVGQSLEDHDRHLMRVRWTLLIGLPTAMILVAGASWWLSGLAMRPAYESYQQIQKFTADAAHELRTPLAAIRSTVEFTLDEPELSEPEVRNTLRVIERQNNRLSNLVQDLLLLSRIDLQNHPVHRDRCPLNRLVEELIEEFSALAIAGGLELKSNIQTTQSLITLGDEDDLYRLFANLVTNAIQYTPAGGEVIIHLNQVQDKAAIAVQDTGPGIPLSEQKHIFDRLYRIHQDRARHTGGSGLGLSIALAIAQAHHSTIHLESDLEKGSTFTVHLPIKTN